MKTSSTAALATGAAALAAVALIAIRSPDRHIAPAPATTSPARVSAAGFSLASVAADLPADDQPFPAGPHADVVNANCASCHSAGMVLDQPPLSADQWKAEVAKMRDVYKAPVAATDVPAIVAYLADMSAKLPGPASGKAQNPDPHATPPDRADGGGAAETACRSGPDERHREPGDRIARR